MFRVALRLRVDGATPCRWVGTIGDRLACVSLAADEPTMRRARRAPFWPGAFAARALLACAGTTILVAPMALCAHARASTEDAPGPIERGELRNGASYVVQRVENAPDGQMSIRLVVMRGASADPIGASGATHVLSHALWDGAMDRLEERAGAGDASASSLLRAMGGRQHAHRGAPIDMFSMSFEFDLSDASEPVVREALRVLTEIVSLEGLDEASFSEARAATLNELRGWAGAPLRVNQRATKAIFEPMGIAPGPYVGRETEVAALGFDAVREVASSLFTRSGMTLVGVASDVNVGLLRDGFSVELPDPAPFCPVFVTPETAGARGVALRDAEASSVVVETVRVERGRFDAREALLRGAGAEAVRRRIEIASEPFVGDEALGGFIVMSKPFSPGAMGAPDVWLSIVHAMGSPNAPGGWAHGMGVVATELRRIELHGFGEGESRLAFERALESVRRDASNERAGSTRDIADRLSMRVAHGQGLISAEREALEAEAMLEGASAEDLRSVVVRAFLGEGELERREFVALAAGNSADETLTDGAALRIATRALTGDAGAPDRARVEPASISQLEDASAARGGVDEVRVDPASDVLTMTLSNNVVAHHRAMREGSGQVVIEATVGGGEIDEIEGVIRGTTDAALSAWRDPATMTLSSRAISDAIAGKGIRVRAWSEQDTVRLSVRAPSEYAEEAALLAGALLRSPRVEAATLERWRQSALDRASMADVQPFERLRSDLWVIAQGGDDPRVSFPDGDDAARVTADDAQAWLDGMLATGSVEVAIVGDIERGKAAEIAARAFASGHARPALSSGSDRADLPARRAGRIESDVVVESLSPHGAALVGVFIDDASGATDWAVGEIAARALSVRVRGVLAGDLAIANEARAMWLPMDGWRGFSLLYTPMVAPKERLDDAAAAAWSEFERLAREGLTPGELETARESLRRSLASDLDEPEAWARALSGAMRRGHGASALLARRDAALNATAEDVRAFVASAMERGSVRTLVRPVNPEKRPE
jgi:zinc protease